MPAIPPAVTEAIKVSNPFEEKGLCMQPQKPDCTYTAESPSPRAVMTATGTVREFPISELRSNLNKPKLIWGQMKHSRVIIS